MRRLLVSPLLLILTGLLGGCAQINTAASDPHYGEAGFFDIHVCNWATRPTFFMGLFSTRRFNEIDGIRIVAPSGKTVQTLELTRYRLVEEKGKPEKRVFISTFDIPAEREEGWYKALVHFKDGRTFEVKDNVVIKTMQVPSGMQPPPDADNVPLPRELRWNPIPDARYYQVFIKDVWADGKLILKSALLREPRLTLPAGLLKPGGSYLWQVHARNLNEDPVWGDFNHGSLSREIAFSVAD